MLECCPETLAARLERAECGVILSNAAGRLLYVNERGRTIVAAEDGLAVRAGRVAGADPAATARLHAAIARASAPCEAGGAPGPTALRLDRPSLRPPIDVVVVPLRPVRAPLPDPAAPSVALFLREPDTPLGLDRAARMNAAYGDAAPHRRAAAGAEGWPGSGRSPTARRATH